MYLNKLVVRRNFWANVALLLTLLVLCGCQQQMAQQPKINPLSQSSQFSNGVPARAQIPDTVSRSDSPIIDTPLYTGKLNGQPITAFPIAINRDALLRGRERYDIFCAVCHDRVGTGNGMIVQRGFTHPASFVEDRLRAAPVGYFFNVITDGYRTMAAMQDRISPEDRWKIVAYIRALQLSQHATANDVPPSQMQILQGQVP